jgi:cyclic di-GMP phosphodiesterase
VAVVAEPNPPARGAASDRLEGPAAPRYVNGVTPDRALTCLVVDDQPRLRSALCRFLTGVGYHCLAAASGPEALDLLAQNDVTVMISDIRMPGMDGVELLQAALRRWPDLAVIMVTGVADVDTAVGCLRVGAYDYVGKPFQLDEIQARVIQAVERRELILENRRYHLHLAELVHQQAVRIEELFLEGIQSIVHALEAKDPYTQGHSARVSAYSGAIARTMALSDEEVQLIELGAELHDVGKIGVDDTILNKQGRLTPEEYAQIMQHTVIGARILEPLLKTAPATLAVVRSHHERLDGRGLPDGLVGSAIPLHARIVSVADAFDAMTTGRAYRPGMPPAAAVLELTEQSGAQFDPGVVEAFVAAHADLTILPIATPAFARRRLPRGVTGAGIDLTGT